jgi:hypothetical protein
MEDSGVNVSCLKKFVWIMLIFITIFVVMMHRYFVLL